MNSFDLWLRRQVLKLEHEITNNPVFEGEIVPTKDELMELRRLTVIHRFLNGSLQQLERGYRAESRSRTNEIDLRDALSTSALR